MYHLSTLKRRITGCLRLLLCSSFIAYHLGSGLREEKPQSARKLWSHLGETNLWLSGGFSSNASYSILTHTQVESLKTQLPLKPHVYFQRSRFRNNSFQVIPILFSAFKPAQKCAIKQQGQSSHKTSYLETLKSSYGKGQVTPGHPQPPWEQSQCSTFHPALGQIQELRPPRILGL